jgi:hypothetical protein
MAYSKRPKSQRSRHLYTDRFASRAAGFFGQGGYRRYM